MLKKNDRPATQTWDYSEGDSEDLVLRHSVLSLLLQCWHPLSVPVEGLDSLLLLQLLVNVPGRAVDDGPTIHGADWKQLLWRAARNLAQNRFFQTLGSKSIKLILSYCQDHCQ